MNIPNILSICRLILVPVFALLYFSGAEHAHTWAVLVYIAAALTDFLDGFIARKYGLETKLGRILDPLGDKIMTLVVLICLTVDRLIPLWAVILFFVKEALMGLGGLLVYRRSTDMPRSNILGKCAAVVFILVCGMLIVDKNISKPMATGMIAFAILVMLAAFVSYFLKYLKIMHSAEAQNKE